MAKDTMTGPASGAGTTEPNWRVYNNAGVLLQTVVLMDQDDNPLTVCSDGDDVSLNVAPGRHIIEAVHLDVANAAADTGYMLVDLSDSTTWPHTETGHVDLAWLDVHVNPDADYLGSIAIGFLSSVGASDGDIHHIVEFPFEKKSDIFSHHNDFGGSFGGVECVAAHVFGATDADDTLWQTAGADITGPAGDTHPCGDGDLVLKVVVAAGQVNVSVTLGYRTEA